MRLFSIILTVWFLVYNNVLVCKTEIIPEQAELVTPSFVKDHYNVSSYRITRFNRTTYVIETLFEIMVDVTNEYNFESSLHYSRVKNSQYTKIPLHIPKIPMCEYLEKYLKDNLMKDKLSRPNNPEYKIAESLCPLEKVFFFSDYIIGYSNMLKHFLGSILVKKFVN